jgi:hypothetical protein
MNSDKPFSKRVVATEPLGSPGASGNQLERITLDDGTRLVRKRVSPEWDWLSRATGDDGRALVMCSAGVFQRIPESIDHATVAVEPDDGGWTVYMRDVSDALVGPEEVLDRSSVRRILAAVADLHLAFWGEEKPRLCELEDRYKLLSPHTARRETERGNIVGDVISRCWEALAELLPGDIATAILALAERPELLSEQLRRCDQTLIHGDVRLSNLGVPADRVVLIDWGERTGFAPAPVELASFLVFDAPRLDVSRDDVIADFRALYGDRFDEQALQLALIGGMVQLGPNPVLEFVLHGTEEARASATAQLTWWTEKVSHALETWSPT